MNTYVLLHCEHKNDVTIIVKLHTATRLRLVAPYRSMNDCDVIFIFEM